MFCHLSCLAGFLTFFIHVPIPGLMNAVVAGVLWSLKKDTSAFINDQGKEALNFQITVFIGGLICFALAFVCIGFFLALGLAVATLILGIIAALKAKEGVVYRYPVCLRLIK